MATLTPEQIAVVAQKSGFTGNDLIVAVAVAMAESGGDERAISKTGDYGVWQINANAHKDLMYQHGPSMAPSTMVAWYNPYINGAIAYKIFKVSGWGAWVTWKRGTYLAHMAKATAAVNTLTNNPGSIDAPDTKSGIGDSAGAAGNLAAAGIPGISELVAVIKWVMDGSHWIRVGEVVGGGILIIVAAYLIARQGGHV